MAVRLIRFRSIEWNPLWVDNLVMESSPTNEYRWPAEWEPHAATWLSWPHNEASWPGKFETVEPAYARMVRALAESEPVWINVRDGVMEDRARRFLCNAGTVGEIEFHHIPTNDAWCRDHGAIFLTRNADDGTPAELVAGDWRYNAWGGKYPHNLDDAVARRMAERLGIACVEHSMVLEGGSIDGNGAGALLTTEACLLHPNRNPELKHEQIEDELRGGLSVREILWLGDGIVGDDTDGHVDDLTRFVDERRVVTVVESDPQDENYQPLRENRERLAAMALDGRALDIVELPMPPAVYHNGQRLPASYANFYIANTKVLLPSYDAATDDRARGILAEQFPTREVEIIDCRDLIWGLGAFHCLTQQVPSA